MDQKKLRVILAVVIGVSLGVSVFIHLERGNFTAAKLVQVSEDLNKRLPLNLDSNTRWDTTIPGPGNCLTYCYTLVNSSKSELNPDDFAAKVKPRLLDNYKTNPEMKLFRENGVTLRYQFKDKAGETVTVIEVP